MFGSIITRALVFSVDAAAHPNDVIYIIQTYDLADFADALHY